MLCPLCQSKETRETTEVGDGGDIKLTLCANQDCGYVHKKRVITVRPDGTTIERNRRVRPEDQPEGFVVEEVEDRIISADEMMRLAIKTREETIGKEANAIVREIIDKCSDPKIILDGKFSYLLTNERIEELPSDVVGMVVSKLADRGYKPRKVAAPGEGTRINIKWPTQKKKTRARKKKPAEDIQITKPKRQKKDPKQAAAANHRKKAQQARSKSPR